MRVKSKRGQAMYRRPPPVVSDWARELSIPQQYAVQELFEFLENPELKRDFERAPILALYPFIPKLEIC